MIKRSQSGPILIRRLWLSFTRCCQGQCSAAVTSAANAYGKAPADELSNTRVGLSCDVVGL